jgi:putative DNA primase/helicase
MTVSTLETVTPASVQDADATAEYAQLIKDIAQAQARYQDLQAHRPDPGDTGACERHRVLAGDASQALLDATSVADCYLREHPQLMPVYGTASAMLAAGICGIPIGAAKKPVLASWKKFQDRLPTPDELHEWFGNERADRGLAVVGGHVSGGLEMLELEGRALGEGIAEEFAGYMREAGLLETWQRVYAGYSELSPGGGLHVLWRCAEVSGNTKLAARPATAEELEADPDHKVRVLIETRGEGGYVVVAPSPGGCHPSGKPWTLLEGSFGTIVTISPEEREEILRCARRCSKVPPGVIHQPPERTKHETLRGPDRSRAGFPLRTRPGDVFNQRGPDWAEILEPRGWRLDRTEANGTAHWTRPGKAAGTSATTGNPQHEGDKFHCFTSSTEFEPDVAYSRFAVFVILEHGGDWGAAAERLARDGYVPGEAHPLSRHASIPRLRVAPPAELDRYADEIVREAVAPVREAAEAARPEDPDADEWGT